MKTIKLDGQVFRIMQRLKKANIPVLRMKIEYREAISCHNTSKKSWFAIFDADTWAVKKAMHPFEGCNPDFAIWNSKVRGTAKIAFSIN